MVSFIIAAQQIALLPFFCNTSKMHYKCLRFSGPKRQKALPDLSLNVSQILVSMKNEEPWITARYKNITLQIHEKTWKKN